MTLSNLIESQRASLRSFGPCMEVSYVADIIAKHREEEAAAKRKVAEIKARYEALHARDR